jgi:hypothetical protein
LDDTEAKSKPLCRRPAEARLAELASTVDIRCTVVPDRYFVVIDADSDRTLINRGVLERVSYQIVHGNGECLSVAK